MDKAFLENPQYSPFFHYTMRLARLVPNSLIERLLPLDPESILNKAKERTGLSKLWGNQEEQAYWRLGLEKASYSLNTESKPYLSLFGRIAMVETLSAWAETQLQVQELLDQHPKILEEELIDPIIITGPPRSMTTHAHSILGLHPDLYYLPFYESQRPVMPKDLKDADLATSKDPRVSRLKLATNLMIYLRPFFSQMFRNGPKEPMEEIDLQAGIFTGPWFEHVSYAPTYSTWWQDADHEVSYRYLKVVLQVIQWQHNNRGSQPIKRWVLKTPEHMGFVSGRYAGLHGLDAI